MRQLENEIRRAIVLSDGMIDRAHLSPEISASRRRAAGARPNVRGASTRSKRTSVREALERTKGNQTQAAKLLGLSRFGLQKMIKRLRSNDRQSTIVSRGGVVGS